MDRAAVVAEAKSWIGTPYHHMARVKKGGVDCAMLLLEVYEAVGLIPRVEPSYYPQDWMLNRSEERYLGEALRLAREIEGPPEPGDAVVVKFGRCFSHGAIVIDWPLCVHATMGQPVSTVSVMIDPLFRKENGELREMKFFSLG